MISKLDKNADRKIRHARVRKKVSGTALNLASTFTVAQDTSTFKLSTT